MAAAAMIRSKHHSRTRHFLMTYVGMTLMIMVPVVDIVIAIGTVTAVSFLPICFVLFFVSASKSILSSLHHHFSRCINAADVYNEKDNAHIIVKFVMLLVAFVCGQISLLLLLLSLFLLLLLPKHPFSSFI
jgi:hypothetical protein